MSKKRVLACIMTFVMLMTIFPANMLAADYTREQAISDNLYDVNKFLEFELVPMADPGDNSSINPGTGVTAAPIAKPENLKVGDIFAIGVRVKNLRNLKAANVGIKQVRTELIYDSNVLVPEPDTYNYDPSNIQSLSWDSYTSGNMNARIQQSGAYGAAVDNPTRPGRPLAGHEGFSYATDGSTVTFDKPTVDDKGVPIVDTTIANPLIYTATASYTGTGTPEFPQNANYDAIANDFIIGVFRFAVKSVPAAGTKVLEFGRTANNGFACVNGASTTPKMFYPEDQEGNWVNSLTLFSTVDESAAVLFPATYTVTYDANADTNAFDFSGAKFVDDATTQETVAEGGNPTLQYDDAGTKKDISSQLVAPTGMVFEGWYLDDACTQKFDTSTVIDQTNFPPTSGVYGVTVYAKYEDGYAVTFNGNNDGKGIKAGAAAAEDNIFPQTHQAANGVALLTGTQTIKADLLGGYDPYKANYTFDGWFEQKADGSKGDPFDDAKAKDTTLTTKVVYAGWHMTDPDNTPNSRIIKFDENTAAANLASNVNPTTMNFVEGESLAESVGFMPAQPTRSDDYTFKGWYTDRSGDGTKIELNTKLDAPLLAAGDYDTGTNTFTVYARWDKAETGDPDDGSLVPDTADGIKVKFDVGTDGTATPAIKDKAIKLGGTIEHMPANPVPTDPAKAFAGWYAELVTPDATDPDGDGNPDVDRLVVEATTPINGDLKDDITKAALAAGGTITLKAKYIDKVAVTVNPNGGTLSTTAGLTAGGTPDATTGVITVLVDPGSNLSAMPVVGARTDYADPPKWYLREDADPTGALREINATNIGDAANAVARASTLFAVWDYQGDDMVTITFNSNGTTQYPAYTNPDGTTTKTYSMKIDPKVPLLPVPDAVRNNYKFKRWDFVQNAPLGDVSNAYTGQILQGDSHLTGNTIEVFAIWETVSDDNIPDVTVKFDMNKPSDLATGVDTVPASIDDIVLDYNDYLGPRYPTDPTLAGYAFKGWYLSTADDAVKVDSTTVFDKNLAVTPALSDTTGGTVTLHAQWQKQVTVTFNANGLGDFLPTDPNQVTTDPMNPGSRVKDLPATLNMPTPVADYSYTWNTAPNGSGTPFVLDDGSGTVGTEVNNSMTVYAIWTYNGDDAVTITFDGNDGGNGTTTIAPAATMKVAPTQVITAAQMPTATRTNNYAFNHWDFVKVPLTGVTTAYDHTKTVAQNAAANGITLKGTGAATGAGDTFPLYAIWDSTDANKVTVKFYEDSTKTPPEYASISLTPGDKVGSSMPANPTKTGETFDKWMTDSTTEFDPNAAISNNTEVYATWNTNPTITFVTDAGAFPDGTTTKTLTVPYGTTWGNIKAVDPQLPYTVEYAGYGEPTRTNHTLNKDDDGNYWLIEPASTTDPVDMITDDYAFTGNVTLHAAWTARLAVMLNNNQLDYNGQNVDPFADPPANYEIFLVTGGSATSPGTVGTVDVKNDFNLKAIFDISYAAVAPDDSFDASYPLTAIGDVGKYKIDYDPKDADPYTEYVPDTCTSVVEVVKRKVDFTFVNAAGGIRVTATDLAAQNYNIPDHDLTDPTGTQAATKALLDKEVPGTPFAAGTNSHWIIAAKPGDGSDPVYGTDKTTKPTAIGDYQLSVEFDATFDKNFEVGHITYGDFNISYSTQDVTFDLAGGSIGGSTDPVKYTVDYGTKIEDGQAVEFGTTNTVTTLPGYDTANSVEGGLITPPVNKKFDSWYYLDADGTTEVPFTAATPVDADRTVYAKYVDSDDATLQAGLVMKETDATGQPVEYRDSTYAVPTPAITFDPATDTYYAQLGNGVEDIYMEFKPSQPGSTVTVALGGVDQTVTAPGNAGDPYVVTAGKLAEAKNGSTNVLTVTVTAPDGTSKEIYTFNLRRLAEAKIVLNYGNSPYGMIMRDSNILPENKEKAKERFNAGIKGTMNMFNPQTDAEKAADGILVPQDANSSIRYNAKAWFDVVTEEYLSEEEINNSEVNMDRNDTAMFVYNWEDFSDPGFTAYDSLGNDVTSQVVRTISVDRANEGVSGKNILDDANVSAEPKTYTSADGLNYTDITVYGQYMIRPKKYTMTYSFHDSVLDQDIAPTRYVIVLLYLGDTNFDGTVNLTDRGELERANKESTVSDNLIYNSRVADTNFDSYVNLTDRGELERANKESTVTHMYPPLEVK